jgi:predicted nucleic acid-binding protein
MTRSLAEEVEATRLEIIEVSSGLDEAIRKIQTGAAQAVVDLVRASADRKANLLVRLSHLEAAASAAGVSIAADHSARQKGNVSAVDAILLALAKGSRSANDVDKAVIAQGLSKSSSEKAKWTCKTNGWVTHSKRIWSITPEGLKKIKGQVPPQET